METLFFKTEAKSRKELRALAHSIRDCLGLKDEMYFPITEVMEILHYFVKDSYYEIVPTTDLDKNVHAYTDIAEHKIVIRDQSSDGSAVVEIQNSVANTIKNQKIHFYKKEKEEK